MNDDADSQRWRRAGELFDDLVELPADEREARLAALAAQEPELRRELEELLAEDDLAGVLDAPAAEALATLIEDMAEVEPAAPEGVLGERIGAYRLVAELGRGGMGVVYLAERADDEFEQQVALKLVKRGLDTDEVLARFRRERQILARLDHRAIAKLLDGGRTADGRPYFAMELVAGEPLTAYCDARGLSIEDRLRLFRRACEAAEHAHRHHVVHRDLKPSNILVTGEGDLKLLDFGVAKVLGSGEEGQDAATLTRMGLRVMTPEYAAPEQVLGLPVSPVTDVYSLGVVLYELLTGRRPYRLAGTYGPDLERTIVEVEPQRPSAVVAQAQGEGPSAEELARARGLTVAALRRRLAGDLDATVLTALRKEPERRYGSAQALAEDLARHLAGQAVKARPDTRLYRASKLLRRRRAAGAVASLMVLAGALVLYLIRREQTTSDAPGPPRLSLGSIQRLTSLPGLEGDPTWSPDGQFVAFTLEDVLAGDIYVKPTSGGDALQLTHDPAYDGEPHWSPDGSTIVFRSDREGGGLFTIPASGGEATRLTDFGYHPRWSPNGGTILFQTRPGYIGGEIQLVEYPGGAPRSLLAYQPGKDSYSRADWSPDGRLVLCQARGPAGARALFIQPLDPPAPGFALEWEGRGIVGIDPVWSETFSAILFRSGGTTDPTSDSNLYFLPVDAGGRVTGPAARMTTGGEWQPVVSPDGRRLAYASLVRSSDLWKIALSPTTGLPAGEPVRVTRGPALERGVAVLPDNRRLLFLSSLEEAWSLYASDIDGQGVEIVDQGHEWLSIDAVSPDGRWLVLSGTEHGGQTIGTYLLPIDSEVMKAAGAARLLGESGGGASFSPDGRYLMVGGLGQSAIVAWEDWASSNPRKVQWPLSADFLGRYPHLTRAYFSPDGAWVAFGAFKERHEPAVFVVRRGSDSPRLVFEGSGLPFWNNDPRRIYLWSETGDARDSRLGFVDFDPATGASGSFQAVGRPAAGESSAYQYWLSPDRRWLFYVGWENEGDLFIADLVRG